MNKNLIRKYVKLIARVGANIKKGQPVIITISVDQYEFANYLVEECYRAGASRVEINWRSQPLTKLDYKYRTLKSLSEVKEWEIEKLKLRVEETPCTIFILSDDPNGLDGIDRVKMQEAKKAVYPIKKPYLDKLENRVIQSGPQP